MKITKKIAILFALSLLFLAPTAVVVFAQPLGQGIGKERGHARMVVQPLLMGHGFALNPSDESQYHVLDVTAMKIGNASQSQTRASLRFAGTPYGLTITSYDNVSVNGNVVTLPPRGTNRTAFTPTTVGTISLSMSKYEGVMLSTGTLTMNSTNYKVLLTSPVIASGGRMHNAKGMFGGRNFRLPHQK